MKDFKFLLKTEGSDEFYRWLKAHVPELPRILKGIKRDLELLEEE